MARRKRLPPKPIDDGKIRLAGCYDERLGRVVTTEMTPEQLHQNAVNTMAWWDIGRWREHFPPWYADPTYNLAKRRRRR